jgi:hypothetical protein
VLRIKSRPENWRVTQVSVKGTAAPAGSQVELRKNDAFITPIIATGGVAAGDPPTDIFRHYDELQVVFTGQTPGTLFGITIFYTLLNDQGQPI